MKNSKGLWILYFSIHKCQWLIDYDNKALHLCPAAASSVSAVVTLQSPTHIELFFISSKSREGGDLYWKPGRSSIKYQLFFTWQSYNFKKWQSLLPKTQHLPPSQAHTNTVPWQFLPSRLHSGFIHFLYITSCESIARHEAIAALNPLC